MTTLGTRLSTWWHGKLVGRDQFGHRYYTEKRPAKDRRARRWVIYNGVVEPTKVPPMWHAWLHHTIDKLPTELPTPHYEWQKEHVPNLSGTAGAYLPPGHVRRGADRQPTVADYQAWTPGE